MTELEPILDVRAIVGEGPIWDGERRLLYWVDVLGSTLYVFDPASGENHVLDVGQHIGTVVPWRRDEVMVAVRHGFTSFDLATGTLHPILDPEEHLPGNRFNDGKCDPAGRFWAGTMAYQDPSDQGSLYRMGTDLEVRKVMDGIGIANGIVWSLDHRIMYYIDTVRADVRAYDYDAGSGEIANERVVIAVPDGVGGPTVWTSTRRASCGSRTTAAAGCAAGIRAAARSSRPSACRPRTSPPAPSEAVNSTRSTSPAPAGSGARRWAMIPLGVCSR